MARIQFCVDSGANCKSTNRSGALDTVEDLGLDEGEYEAYTEAERLSLLKEWANERIEIWTEVLD